MSKTKTDVSKYRSPSTGDYCTSAQYIAEIICQRSADKEKVGTLPYKFWNLPKWKKLYVRQVALANKLVNKHGDNFVKFIQSKSGKYILSLGMKNIEEKYKHYLSSKPEQSSEILTIEKTGDAFARQGFGNNSLLARLNRIKT